MKYYYSLSCSGSMFKSGDFSREIEQFVQNANGNFCWKTNILEKLTNKRSSEIFARENRIIWEICLEK